MISMSSLISNCNYSITFFLLNKFLLVIRNWGFFIKLRALSSHLIVEPVLGLQDNIRAGFNWVSTYISLCMYYSYKDSYEGIILVLKKKKKRKRKSKKESWKIEIEN